MKRLNAQVMSAYQQMCLSPSFQATVEKIEREVQIRKMQNVQATNLGNLP